MLKIDRAGRTLTPLPQKGIPDAGLKERSDLQQMIRNSPEAFFREMGEELLLIGAAIRPARDACEDEIDLLAIDKDGAIVVIELKRDRDRLQLLQAIAYAGMIARWPQDRLAQERAVFAGKSLKEAEEEIEEFIDESVSELNQVQRVVLIAQDFDFEVLVAAEWLSEHHDVDVRCFRLALSSDGNTELLTCTCIYPPPELTKAAIRRGRIGRSDGQGWTDWDTALEGIENPDAVEFFRKEAAASRESNVKDRCLIYRVGGKRRFYASARRKHAYVWQTGRFPDDEQFWRERLGPDATIEPVQGGHSLRFHLVTKPQFGAFEKAVTTDQRGMTFSDGLLERAERT